MLFTAIGVIVVGLILAFVLSSKKKVIGDSELLSEINQVEQLSIYEEGKRNVTVEDVQRLKKLSAKDETALTYAEDIEWLVEKGETLHLKHTLSFMRDYISTGEDIPCLPHELWHISLFAKYGDLEHAREHAAALREEYLAWEESVEQKKKKFPQYYTTLDTLKENIRQVIPKIEQGDYSKETLEKISEIGQAGLC